MSSSTSRPWCIFGYGRVARLFERLAMATAQDVSFVWNRELTSTVLAGATKSDIETLTFPPHSICWILVADDAIADVAAAIYKRVGPASSLVHASGSLTSNVLQPLDPALRRSDVDVASLHPLLSVTMDTDKAFSEATNAIWTLEGSPPTVAYLKSILASVGVAPNEISANQKPLYHAAAVAASGLVTSTFDLAITLAQAAGFSHDDAFRMLIPLIRSTVDNLDVHRSITDALTGPMARKDYGVIERHYNAFNDANLSSDTIMLYRMLVERLLPPSGDSH